MPDHLLHIIDQKRHLAIVFAITTDLVAEACKRHSCGRIASFALSKALTGTALIGANLKDGERQSAQINTNGQLRSVIAEATSDGALRGYPSSSLFPDLDHAPANYIAALGNESNIAVVRSHGGQTLYNGSITTTNPTIRKDFNEYMHHSEQLFAVLDLYTHYHKEELLYSAGVMVRLLPGGDEAVFNEEKERFDKGDIFTALAQTRGSLETIRALWPTMDVHASSTRALRFECNCNRERVRNMIASLGAIEICKMIDEDGDAEVSCHFCGEDYHFEEEELRAILDEF